MRTRTRELPNNETISYIRQIGDTITNYDVSSTWQHLYPNLLLQQTMDEIHVNYPYEGGPFDSTKAHFDFTYGSGKTGQDYIGPSGPVRLYRQGTTAVKPKTPTLSLPASTYADALAQGASAWDKFKPAKPDVSLSVFFAELRDLPGLMFKKLNSFRSLGNNYLALQFGWKPFLRDIRDWYESVVEIDKRVEQLRRDNGRYIKRGGTVFQNEDTSTRTWDGSNHTIFLGVPVHQAMIQDITTDYERCWFSARFRYYIPGLDDSKFGKLRAIQELYDLKITPEQVYQLIPYSWLVDWFSNLGSVVSNYISQVDDSLTAKYAYVMYEKKRVEERIADITYQVRIGSYDKLSFTYPTTRATAKLTTCSKARRAASPFGFNVSFDGLTGYQTSILAALGLSRLRF